MRQSNQGGETVSYKLKMQNNPSGESGTDNLSKAKAIEAARMTLPCGN